MTLSEVQAQAGWALWGKEPGSSRDYSVLAASAQPLSRPEFTRVLTYFAPGNPPTEPGWPGSLPWVTISRVGVSERLYLAIAVQEATGHLDGAARPITQTRYFCVPYAELQDSPVSYADLYAHLAGQSLPREDDGLIPLSLPPVNAAALARSIVEEFGESVVAGTAALLLGGPVSVIGSEGTDVLERLRFLDAVAALLPYGYRAWFSAATWSDSEARHPIRLAFAARPRQDAGVVRWRSDARPRAAEAGRAYLRRFRQVREWSPGLDGLTELIAFLATSGTPRNFEQPQHAAETLRDFRLPFFVRAAVCDGSADLADIRSVLTGSRAAELPGGGARELLAGLIAGGAAEDLPLIRKWWAAVDGDSGAMLPALVQVCSRLFASAEVRKYTELAGSCGLLDSLLAELIGSSLSRADDDGAKAAAQLVADGLGDGLDLTAAPRTRQALAGNPLVACELLAQLTGADQHAILAWLDPVLPACTAPFSVVLAGTADMVDHLMLTELAAADPECVRVLLRAASDASRLGQVLPEFANWIARTVLDGGPLADSRSLYWRNAVGFAPDDPAARAWIDLALLVSGNFPRYLLPDPDQPGWPDYNQRVAVAWRELAAELGEPGDGLLTSALVRYLEDPALATAGAAQSEAVQDLKDRLASDGNGTGLEALVGTPFGPREPLALSWGAPRPAPASHPDGIRRSLRDLGPGVTAAEIAELCSAAFVAGVDARDVARAMAETGVISSGALAYEVLEELRCRLLPRARATLDEQRRLSDWLQWLARQLADSDIAPPTAEEFAQTAVPRYHEEIRYRLGLVHIVAQGRRQHPPPGLDDDDLDQLDEIREFLGKFLADARHRPAVERLEQPER